MNLQPVVQPRPSANGIGRRRVEKEIALKLDNKSHSVKPNSGKLIAGVPTSKKEGGNTSLSRERLVFLTTCLIGHNVEVQVSDGSVFSGIFHATNVEKDFGVILKMASLIKVGSSWGHENILDSVSKPPSKTMIIPATELVQIIAKDVSLTRNELANELHHEKQLEIMTDSYISQSRHVDAGRELERWVPDEDNPECPELENIFDGKWNRGWDQFEVNETLFGVKSTFDEDLYTTKLDRGPQTRELERQALRIAREIEGEDTKDLHLAEERGILHEDCELDEETRFSSVFRGVDDSGVNNEESVSDIHNDETFGDVSDRVISRIYTEMTIGKHSDGAEVSSSSSSVDEVQSSNDHARQSSTECASGSISALDGESRTPKDLSNEGHSGAKESVPKQMLNEEARPPKTNESQSLPRPKKESSSDKGVLSPNAPAFVPSCASSKGQDKKSCSELQESATPGKTQSLISNARPGSSTSSTSDCGNAAVASSGLGLSPSPSVCSLSSEKSTLNPHAKEFKLNSKAKSFVPAHTPLRPLSPVSDGSFYYPSNVAAVQHIHALPVGFGMGPPFSGYQPVMYPQAPPMQSPQPYFHPNGPQYGQQMMLGQPRQVMYMQAFPPEMQIYKGRDF